MLDQPQKEAAGIIDITGPEGETLFWHAKAFITIGISTMQKEIEEMWSHISELSDDRLLAIVGSLCIENMVDALLRAIGPGFQATDDVFTFSAKIKVARSLRMIPSRVLTCCDLVRQFRNEFAHNLESKEFGDLDQKYLKRLAPSVTAYDTTERSPADYRALFKTLVSFTILALSIYTRQVERLREYLDTAAFREGFKSWIDNGNK